MKKHWTLLVGASLLTGLAGSLLLKKKQGTSDAGTSKDIQRIYIGQWWFVNKNKATQHTLEINSSFSLSIDGKKINSLLVELTPKRFVIQDEFGYHLIVQSEAGQPVSLYDEADDETYQLSAIEEL